MTLLAPIHLAHTSPTTTLYASLHTSVTNASFLRSQLLAGNADFEYAFIDASNIISTTHVLAAAFRAINDLENERLRTRNVHSEIVFGLSPTNNIASSLNTFGITADTTNVLVLKVDHPGFPITEAEAREHLSANIEGTAVPFTDESLAGIADIARIRKVYKLGSGTGGGGGQPGGKGGKKGKANGVKEVNGDSGGDDGRSDKEGEEVEKKEMEVMILGMMALKGS